YVNLSGIEKIKSDFDKARDYEFKALEIDEAIGDRSAAAQSNQDLAQLYNLSGDQKTSLTFAFKALRLSDSLPKKDLKLEASIYGVLAQIYSSLMDYPNCIRYNLKALSIDSVTNDLHGMMSRYNNIGSAYEMQKRNDEAIKYYMFAVGICKKMNYKFGYCIIMTNIGNIYCKTGNYVKAMECQETSLKLAQELHADLQVAFAYANMASVYLAKKEYDKAIEFYMKGMAIDQQLKAANEVLEDYYYISKAYETKGDFKNALLYTQLFVNLKDSVIGIENTRQFNEMQTRYDSEKKDNEIKIKNLELDKKESALGKQRLISILVGLGLLSTVVAGFFVLRNYRQKKVANKALSEKNKIIEEKSLLLEEKNKEITDSIHYAKRIQTALMASDKLLKEQLDDYFIFYQPKDIVSGDFYWAAKLNKSNQFSIATCDCTGHGVPGAFMSLLNISFLNEVTIQKNISSPDLVFNAVREEIVHALNPSGSTAESKDGMDAVLCNLNTVSLELEFAAANNPLLVVRKGELIKHTADKYPVGLSYGELKPFTLQKMQLQKGDLLYTFTDGFGDQFGGPKGKKFKHKNLEQLLVAIHSKPMEEQKKTLEQTISSWRGPLEQVDDILVIGIKV
ncbi:MAG: tetratricopeptide repeat protein, partial [Bacteroidia bacterium]